MNKTPDQKLLNWLATQDKDVRELVAICVGAASSIYSAGTDAWKRYDDLYDKIVSLPTPYSEHDWRLDGTCRRCGATTINELASRKGCRQENLDSPS